MYIYVYICTYMYIYIYIYVTQHGSWYPSGELVNSSKPIIKGYMVESMKNRLILLKTFTDIEFYGEYDKKIKNIENLMTIALWEFFRSIVFNPLIFRITGVCMLPWQQ